MLAMAYNVRPVLASVSCQHFALTYTSYRGLVLTCSAGIVDIAINVARLELNRLSQDSS